MGDVPKKTNEDVPKNTNEAPHIENPCCPLPFSELECQIINDQTERRCYYRMLFLKKRTDPCLHSKEAGFVFDEAMQRFISMKATQFEYFKPCWTTSLFGICAIVLPMLGYGYLVWKQRSEAEALYRCGKIKYRDRLFKLQ